MYVCMHVRMITICPLICAQNKVMTIVTISRPQTMQCLQDSHNKTRIKIIITVTQGSNVPIDFPPPTNQNLQYLHTRVHTYIHTFG